MEYEYILINPYASLGCFCPTSPIMTSLLPKKKKIFLTASLILKFHKYLSSPANPSWICPTLVYVVTDGTTRISFAYREITPHDRFISPSPTNSFETVTLAGRQVTLFSFPTEHSCTKWSVTLKDVKSHCQLRPA